MKESRIRKEKRIIEKMIHIFCEGNHNPQLEICDDCKSLLDYAELRLQKCPYGEQKPICKKCKIHCYKPDSCEQIKKIMRFSGPRIFFRSPFLAIWHICNK